VRQAIIDLAARRKGGTHPGLILQRYLVRQSDPKERRALLDAACEAARGGALRSVYALAYDRWNSSFVRDKPFSSALFTTSDRLIVGLGSENVLEAGLRLHHTYGVPIIPGSALKGLSSHYCHDVWGQRHNELVPVENTSFQHGGVHHSLLFGTTQDGGVITFHDAWLTPDSLNDDTLRLDVMTPHHPRWQMNGAPPTDFDSPNPVSFLSVVGAFNLRLSWSGPADTPPEQAATWIGLALALIKEALAEWGIGGKISSGYGRLLPSEAFREIHHSSVRSSDPGSSIGSTNQSMPPKANEKVDAVLLEERTKKGGWRAIHRPSGLSGDIQNSAAVPSDNNPGDTVELLVAFANQRQIAFKYPTPEEEARRAASIRRGGSKQGPHDR
jgi:CRISPR-associated protein Cmr6